MFSRSELEIIRNCINGTIYNNYGGSNLTEEYELLEKINKLIESAEG